MLCLIKMSKQKESCSDLQLMSGFFYTGAFTKCFLYDSKGNITGLDTMDDFVKGRPDTLMQLHLIQLIREVDYECKKASIIQRN